MSEETKPSPLVLISYSHDSEGHKAWVRELATALREIGIDVILDQWEIGPGDDVPKFMEQSVRRALRVIMVCTEQYVRKADDGKGGAGYEAMVVTGELINDLGTRKFVPILRQTSETPTLPACVSTRFFVDFSKDDEFAKKVEDLARNIHEAPKFEKPPLGKNPFTGGDAPGAFEGLGAAAAPAAKPPYQIYEVSMSLATAGNFAKWRELIHKAKVEAGVAMIRWKAENQRNTPATVKDLSTFFLPAVATHTDLFAAAFGAFDSSDQRFHNQLSLLDWIRNPKDWERGGNSIWTQLPELAVFAYQALLGGLAMNRQRPEMAYNLAMTPFADGFSGGATQPLYKSSRFVGWPESLNNNCSVAWVFLQKLAKEWDWLWKLFGSEEDTLAAVAGYYLFLNTIDFVSATKATSSENGELRNLESPLFFVRAGDDVYNRAQNLYFESSNFIRKMFADNKIVDERLPALWSIWIKQCGRWINEAYSGRWSRHSLLIPHHDLPKMLLPESNRFRID